jgi:two-component system, LytTR family, sensor histidine kinase AlgZ
MAAMFHSWTGTVEEYRYRLEQMNSLSTPELEDMPPVRSLPVELWVLCAGAPVLYLPVLHRRIFEEPLGVIAASVAENLLPFVVIPLFLEALYRWVLPPWLHRIRGIPRRLAAHLLIATVVSTPLGMALQQVIVRLRENGPPLLGFTLSCVVITWTLVVPALLVQEYRQHAAAGQRRLEAQRQATLRAELEALQSRTHPHFLFNALNTIASLIPSEPLLAEATVERLADLLRYSLRTTRRPKVPLSEEIERVKDYLEVQRARFGARLVYTVSVEPGAEGFEVPPLMLLPLVENAVLHSIAPRVAGGALRVCARRDAAGLELLVEDGGGERSGATSSGTGTALADLRRRLSLLYGGRASLRLTENEAGGITAALRLPAGTLA